MKFPKKSKEELTKRLKNNVVGDGQARKHILARSSMKETSGKMKGKETKGGGHDYNAINMLNSFSVTNSTRPLRRK